MQPFGMDKWKKNPIFTEANQTENNEKRAKSIEIMIHRDGVIYPLQL